MKKLLLTFIIFCCAMHGVQAQTWILNKDKRTNYAGFVDTVRYAFPLITATDSSRLDTADVLRETKYLHALQEPVIFSADKRYRVFRFTWLRKGGHPVVIRMVNLNGHITIYWKECDGTGDSDPGKLILNQQKEITKADWAKFSKMTTKINRCKVDTSATARRWSEWILEGAVGPDLYMFGKTVSPAKNDELYKCCDYLTGLTGMLIEDDKKY